jgi:hypothetical protein
MSRRTTDLTSQIYQLFNEKLENQLETMDENKILYQRLLDTTYQQSNDGTLSVNHPLISRIDDILDDMVRMNVTMKLVLHSLERNTPLTTSTREPERTLHNERIDQYLRDNNVFAAMYLLMSQPLN